MGLSPEEWVLYQEYHFAAPPETSHLHSARFFLLALSWAVILYSVGHLTRSSLRSWQLPGLQAGALQVTLAVAAAAVPSTLAVQSGYGNAMGHALQAACLGFALLATGIALPLRVVAACAPGAGRERHEQVCSLAAVVALVVLRPLDAALHLLPKGDRARLLLDATLMTGGSIAVWVAGKRDRRGVVGKHLPKICLAYYTVSSLCWAWLLQEAMQYVSSGDGSQDTRTLVEVLQVIEAAGSVALLAFLQAPERDPLVQLAATVRKARVDAEEQDLLFSLCSGWPLRLRAAILVLDISRPLREACSKPASTPGSYWLPLASAEEEGERPGSVVPREVLRARRAWNAWAAASGIHQAWRGVRKSEDGLELIPPGQLTDEEREEYEKKQLQIRSFWPWVLSDLSTERVHSKNLAVVVAVTAAHQFSEPAFLTDYLATLQDPVSVFFAQIAYLSVLWLLLGVLLIGNNTFSLCHAGYRAWAFLLAAWLLFYAWIHTQQFLLRREVFWDNDPMGQTQRWFEMSLGLLALAGFFLAVRVATQAGGRSDYHNSMMSSLWYTSDLLKPMGGLQEMREKPVMEGEEVLIITRGGTPAKAKVTRRNLDGTSDVALHDGTQYGALRHKHMMRETPGDVEEEETKDKRLRRFKRLFSAAEEYPPTLYFGAIFVIPALIAITFCVMQWTKRVLHRLYQVHVLSCLLAFFLNGYVVPEGPPGVAWEGRQALSRQIGAWRATGGIGPANATNLHAQSISALHFRWDTGTSEDPWPSTPCAELKAGPKMVALLAQGRSGGAAGAVDFTWDELIAYSDYAWSGMWVPYEAVEVRKKTLGYMWEMITGANESGALTGSAAGDLLCEAKLLFGQGVALSPGEEFAFNLAWEGLLIAQDTLAHKSARRSNIVHAAMLVVEWSLRQMGLEGLIQIYADLQDLLAEFRRDPLSVRDPAAQLRNLTEAAFDVFGAVAPEMAAQVQTVIDQAQSGFQTYASALPEVQGLAQNLTELAASAQALKNDLPESASNLTASEAFTAEHLKEELVNILQDEAKTGGSSAPLLEGQLGEIMDKTKSGCEGSVAAMKSQATASVRRISDATASALSDFQGRVDQASDDASAAAAAAAEDFRKQIAEAAKGATDGDQSRLQFQRLADEAAQKLQDAIKAATAQMKGDVRGAARSASQLSAASAASAEKQLDETSDKAASDASATTAALQRLAARSRADATDAATASAERLGPKVEQAVARAVAKAAAQTDASAGELRAFAAQAVATAEGAAATVQALREATTSAVQAAGAAGAVVEATGVRRLRDGAGPSGGGPPPPQPPLGGHAAPDGPGLRARRRLWGVPEVDVVGILTNNPVFQVMLTVINFLSQDWIPFVLIGVKWNLTVSLLSAFICILYVISRCFTKYRELFESMQSGKHDYKGLTHRPDLDRGFSETTMFPGVLLGTCIISFFFVTFAVFITLTIVILSALPMCLAQWIQPFLPSLKVLGFAYLLKKMIQIVLLDGLLVDSGEVVYPAIFSLFWFIQLVLNLGVGFANAVARCAVVLATSALSCCFMDFTVLPESLVSLDTGYYSLLTAAYTHHHHGNPIKMAAVCMMQNRSHRVYGPSPKADLQPSRTLAARRVRARFFLALTLHNNPELRPFRVHGRPPSDTAGCFGSGLSCGGGAEGHAE